MKIRVKTIFIISLSLLLISIGIFANNKKSFWQIRPAKEILFSNQADKNQIFIPSDRKNIQAIDINSGEANWQFNSGNFINSQLIILDKNLLFMTEDQSLFSINTKNGQLQWRKNFGLKAGQIQKYENYLLLSQLDGKITLINSDGEIIWETITAVSETNPSKSYSAYLQSEIQNWSMKFLFDKSSIYVFFQNVVSKIDAKSGQLLWTNTLEKQIVTQALLIDDVVVFVNQEGEIIGLNSSDGHVEWKKTINQNVNSQIASINFLSKRNNFLSSLSNNIRRFFLKQNLFLTNLMQAKLAQSITNSTQAGILLIDHQGAVSFLEQNELETVWQTETELPFARFLDSDKHHILIANHEQILALNYNGSVAWKKDIPLINQYLKLNSFFFNKLLSFNKEIIVLTSFEKNIFALNAKNGQIIWEFNSYSSTSSPLIELPRSLIIVSDNGLIYQINKFRGTVSENIKIKHEVNQENLKNKDIFKINFLSKKQYFQSPFYQVKIDCSFQSPSGSTHQQAGFYYDYNQWQVRFNPQENGEWLWQCNFSGPGVNKGFSGSFRSQKNTNEFVQLQDESRFLTLDGKSLFFPLGLNHAMTDYNQNSDYFDDFYIGVEQEDKIVDLNEYLDIYYKEGGFNTFRWNPGNHQFFIAANIRYPENDYSIANSKLADYLLENLYQRDIQVYSTLFAWGLPSTSIKDPQEEFAINHYLEYMVARYGAYTSVWELTNEGVLDDKTAAQFLNKLKTLDPGKPLSISWQKPQLEEVNIISPHWYSTSLPAIADTEILKEIDKFKEYQKPIVFGEIGNGTKNWDENSALIMRVRAWTTLFNGGGLIFWNSSHSKEFYNEAFKNANQYIGPEERQYMKVISDFSKQLSADLERKSFINNLTTNNTRVYTLTSEKEWLAYAYHFAHSGFKTKFSFKSNLEQTGHLQWLDPKTGEVVSNQQLSPGSHLLESPLFQEDLVLKIEFNQVD
jgi:outer membrane protein assembly factor BamB